NSARPDVKAFFEDFKIYLAGNKHLRQAVFNHEELETNTYHDISFKNIVLCKGMGFQQNPSFTNITVLPHKGHQPKVTLSAPFNHQFTIKTKHFLFPLLGDLYYYGGTYDRFETGNGINDSAVSQLKNGLAEFYTNDSEVAAVNYGWRPTVKDRRPILGRHPE